MNGKFTEKVSDLEGIHVKEADKLIIEKLKETRRLVRKDQIIHGSPFCWRSDTPLLYKAVPRWFVKVEGIKEKLVKNHQQMYWIPSFVKENRFQNWLENAIDWDISRNDTG